MGSPAQRSPDLVGADFRALEAMREKLRGGDGALVKDYALLLKKADETLVRPAESVIGGDVPPSGDRHDFFSIGKYAWPNPKTPDGMPYVRLDCKINPESRGDRYDLGRLDKMFTRVGVLTRAWFYSGDEKYAAKSAEVLKVWFINPETRMNPNFNFAAATPGVCDGMSAGIIFGSRFVSLVDCAKLLTLSKSWSAQDAAALKLWFGEYKKWLLESEFGTAEAKMRNNHGTWYYAQVAAISLYVGDKSDAEKAAQAGKKCVADQVAKDGSFPRETRRMWALSYSVYSLRAFAALSACSERAGVDLWHYKTEDGRGLQLAYEFLSPYISGDKEWNKGVVRENEDPYKNAYPAFMNAAKKYDSPEFNAAVQKLKTDYPCVLTIEWF